MSASFTGSTSRGSTTFGSSDNLNAMNDIPPPPLSKNGASANSERRRPSSRRSAHNQNLRASMPATVGRTGSGGNINGNVGSHNSSPQNRIHRESIKPSSASHVGSSSSKLDPQFAFMKTLSHLKLPPGLLTFVLCYATCDSRLWILDNSSSMSFTKDGHRIAGQLDNLKRVDHVTRWSELQECVAFHTSMAARCWIPTKFWLVNPPSTSNSNEMLPQKFCVCWGKSNEVPSEKSEIDCIMNRVVPELPTCPMGKMLNKLSKAIAESRRLRSSGKQTTVVICTQGLPTDKEGNSNSSVYKEYEEALATLCKLPVKLIIRLCTDDEQVRDWYNTFDNRLEGCDVLDDYWGEAIEIYLHNPWLTYGVGLHRLRESGLAPEIMDDLDERPFTLKEIHKLCTKLFIGDNGCIDLPDPRRNLGTFLRVLSFVVEKEQLQWNPVKKKQMPWIDLKRLEFIFAESPPQQPSQPTYQRKQSNQGMSRRSSQSSPRPPQDPPGNSSPRQQQQQRRRSSKTVSEKPPVEELTLEKVLQRWSHKGPDYKSFHSLDRLLVTVPTTFPPTNSKVEAHDYFSKWKTFDKDAFNEEGEAKKELLKRAVRKSKFFLHTDKLPKDLTENQTLLFKTIWDVIQEREMATLSK